MVRSSVAEKSRDLQVYWFVRSEKMECGRKMNLAKVPVRGRGSWSIFKKKGPASRSCCQTNLAGWELQPRLGCITPEGKKS